MTAIDPLKKMVTIADFIGRVLVEGEDVASVRRDVEDFRLPWQDFYYNFDHGWPPGLLAAPAN